MKISRLASLAVLAAACGVPPSPVPLTDAPPPDVPFGTSDAMVDAGDHPDGGTAQLRLVVADGLDFGDVVVGADSSAHHFTIANDGDGASDTLTITTSSAAFTIGGDQCSGQVVDGGAACDFTIAFAPSATGAVTATLHVATPGGPIAAFDRSLGGTGQAAASLSIDPITSTDFGQVQVGKPSAAKTFTVTNDGDVPTGALAVALADPSDFALANDDCTGALAGRTSCTFDVEFTPAAAGPAATQVQVTGAGPALTRDVSGTGLTQGAVDLVDDAYDFGAVAVDGGARSHTFTVRNTGQVTIGAPAATISPASGTGYTIASSTCTAALAPTGTCTITVGLDPTTLGSHPASLVATSSGGGSDSASLASVGVAHVKVVLAGTGSGTVRSSSTGIDCPATGCEADFSSTPLTLTAANDAMSAFVAWAGCDHPSALSCALDLAGARTVTATFAPTYPLTIAEAGIGTGTVTGTGITCPGDCSERFAAGTMVQLAASANAGSSFSGWSGDCTGTATTCTVSMVQARNVTATFVPIYTLTVGVTGSGTVGAQSLACNGGTCTGAYPAGTTVIVAATPSAGTAVAWSGCTTANGNQCSVTMDQNHTVSATFSATNVSVAVTVTGLGSVASMPGGIACPGTCSAAYAYGSTVTLTATPSTGQTFTGWTGGTCTGTAPCIVNVAPGITAAATFTPNPETLTVMRTGAGSGTVTSDVGGISCGASCSSSYDYNSQVKLSAAPASGSTFAGWGGACTGTGACTVTMTQAQSVTASFTLSPTTLSVTKNGTGLGTVTSMPSGIACGATCSADFPNNTQVTLMPSAATGSMFTGWAGACTGTGACVVTVDQARSVTATFDANTYTLSVTKAGNGTVTSNTGAINCGTACSATFTYGTMVTLNATTGTGSTFSGWTGACTGSLASCTVLVDQARSTTATFTTNTYTLQVARAGSGGGTVTSNIGGINCGAACSASFNYGDTVTLMPAAAAGSSFTGWSGACTGSGGCTVTIDQAKSVTATFDLSVNQLSVTRAGTGSGTVTSNPAGINCGATCGAGFTSDKTVNLVANNSTGSSFTKWTGDCTGTGSCSVTMDQARSVTATFTQNSYTVSVTKTGNGGGTVTSNVGGINCGATCSKSIAYGTSVSLSVTPDGQSTFTGWGGACSGTGACSFTVSATTSVTATFTLKQYTVSATASPSGGGTISGTGTFNAGTSPVITASANAGYTFAGWTGNPACSGTGSCTFASIAANQTVTATFTAITPTVGVTVVGGGTVTSNPAGISCPGTCSHAFSYNSTLSLSASASAGYSFTGWSGACTGTGACSLTPLTANQSVTATFTAITPTISVTVVGSGGTVTSNPSGITCTSGTCSHAFPYGSSVSFNALGSGSSFSGWSGACTGASCSFPSLTSNQSVTATFVPLYTVTTVASPSAGGTVSGGGTFTAGSNVTLTAAAAAGYAFSSWTNCPSPNGATCKINGISASVTVTANFAQPTYSVTVTSSGDGSGTFSGSVPCGSPPCTLGGFHLGDQISITANPGAGMEWDGWAYPCQGQGPACTFTLGGDVTVTAFLDRSSYTLTLGTHVTCSSGCQANPYPRGAQVTLHGGYITHIAKQTCIYVPDQWFGCTPDSQDNTVCYVTMTSDHTVSATFTETDCVPDP